jgi:Undecaprenyl-phosphate galactose phosphotransferase WbaP
MPSQQSHFLNIRFARAIGLWLADACVCFLAYLVVQPGAPLRFAVLFGLWTYWALSKRSYTHRLPFWTQLLSLLKWSLGITCLSIIARLLARDFQAAEQTVAYGAILMLCLPLGRAVAQNILQKLGFWNQEAVVFGSSTNALQSYLAIQAEPSLGYKIKAFIKPIGMQESDEVKLLCEAEGLSIHSWRIDATTLSGVRGLACIVALEANQAELRDQLLNKLAEVRAKNVMVIPAMRGVPLFGLSTTQFFSHEVLMIHVRNQLAKPLLKMFKRVFDLLGASTLLLLLSPLFAYVAWKVSRDGSSAFFGHERVGQDGHKFKCYKFRSMVVNAQEVLQELLARDPLARAEWEKDFKLKNDPRINPIGHFLRRTSLDELPQLWNVLKGEMSLVGPRPVVQDELARYGEDVVYYLMAKPGMTGLWQVSGRNDVDYDTRVYFDAWYVKNWSLWTDIAILFKTISVVMGRRGAY